MTTLWQIRKKSERAREANAERKAKWTQNWLNYTEYVCIEFIDFTLTLSETTDYEDTRSSSFSTCFELIIGLDECRTAYTTWICLCTGRMFQPLSHHQHQHRPLAFSPFNSTNKFFHFHSPVDNPNRVHVCLHVLVHCAHVCCWHLSSIWVHERVSNILFSSIGHLFVCYKFTLPNIGCLYSRSIFCGFRTNNTTVRWWLRTFVH